MKLSANQRTLQGGQGGRGNLSLSPPAVTPLKPRKPGSLTGRRMKAPCWYCSKKLHGGNGAVVKVDGNPVAMHHECAEFALEDEDLKGRVETEATP